MLSLRFWLVCLGVAIVAMAAPLSAQRPLASTDAQLGVETNPHQTPEDVAAGKQNFDSRCANCHGPVSAGPRSPAPAGP